MHTSHTFYRFVLILTALVVLLPLTSCRENKVAGQKPDGNKPVVTVTEALHPSNFDRVVTVKGVIKEVCQDEGCWMTITDGVKTVRMTFKDAAFQVGLKSKGDVLVTGTVHEEIVTEEAARAMGASIGMTEQAIQQLAGDQRWALMTASGVEFLQPQP